MRNNCLDNYREFVKPLYIEKDTTHNFDHIERMIGKVELLKTGYESGINIELLWFLTCFHGLKSALDNSNTKRKEWIMFLGSIGWSQDDILFGFNCLDRHLSDPVTVEEQIVHDANYIELLGAFGIAKAFTTGGAHNQSYHETIKIYEEEYLDKVGFRTVKGKELATEGKIYAKDFLNRLKQELQS